MWHKSLAVASTGRLDSDSLVFPWAQGVVHPRETKNVDLPLSLRPVECILFSTGAVTGLEDLTAPMTVLSKFTQQTLHDSQQILSLLNTERFLMTEAGLQNRVAECLWEAFPYIDKQF